MKIALVEIANTENITIVNNEGNYRLDLPDGSQVSPVFAGWTGEKYMLREIDFDTPTPTFLNVVAIASPGSGYTVNDTLTVSGGTGNSAQVQVSSIGSNGTVTGLSISNSGFYTSNPPLSNTTLTGGTGTGAKATLDMEFYNYTSTYSYDTDSDIVIEINTYETPIIDNSLSVEAQRQTSLTDDISNQNLMDKLRTATPAQIDTWLTNNVTNLAEARIILGAIVKFLAIKFRGEV